CRADTDHAAIRSTCHENHYCCNQWPNFQQWTHTPSFRRRMQRRCALVAHTIRDLSAIAMLRQPPCEYDSLNMIHLLDDEGGQGMVEYLLIVSLVVLTIVGLFAVVMRFFTGT